MAWSDSSWNLPEAVLGPHARFKASRYAVLLLLLELQCAELAV
jgi:hypothetical protein